MIRQWSAGADDPGRDANQMRILITQAPLQQPALTMSRVRLHTGIDMHYVAKAPEGSESPGNDGIDRALILVHGYSDSWRSFEELLDLLPFDGYNVPVFAPDLRGHGASSGSTSHAYTQADFAADIAAFMDALKIGRATVVGHSMGGLIAHKVAVEYPSRVEKLVLISTAATLAGHPILAGLKPDVEAMADDEPAPVDFVQAFQNACFYMRPEPRVLHRYVSESLRLRGKVWKEALIGMDRENHRDRLPHVAAPTLILWGEQDALFTREQQEELNLLLPDARVVIYPEAGHTLNVERTREVARDIQRFVRETTPGEVSLARLE